MSALHALSKVHENMVAKAQATPQYYDELYSYDGSNRLTEMQRGQLAGTPPSSITNLRFAQDWALDRPVPKIVARVFDHSWLVSTEVRVTDFATIRRRRTHRMSSHEGFTPIARSGSAATRPQSNGSEQNLRRFAAVAFQQSAELLHVKSIGKRRDWQSSMPCIGKIMWHPLL